MQAELGSVPEPNKLSNYVGMATVNGRETNP